MDIFVLFLWTCIGKSATVLFLATTPNIDNETLAYLVEV